MSQFIYDEVYGSEARKRKILQNSNYLYYRQIMKIKSKHEKNPLLYSEIYELRNPQSSLIKKRQKSNYSPQILLSLNQNNYMIQKLNPHAFKIVKRKQRAVSSYKINPQVSLQTKIKSKLLTVHDSDKKLTSRSIHRDAQNLERYFHQNQQLKSINRNKNKSLDLSFNKSFKTSSKFNISQFKISPFSKTYRPELSQQF